MTMTIGIFDQNGATHQAAVNLEGMRAAQAAGFKHIGAHFDALYPTKEGQPTATQQMYQRLGAGMKGVKAAYALNGLGFTAGALTEEGAITGRLATLAYLMDTIENKLTSTDYGISALFNSKAAIIDTIPGTKFERPVLDFTAPEQGRSRAIAQLAEPASMMLLTVSDKSFKIAGTAIGLEISDEAANATSLALVSLSMGRQAETENLMRVESQMLGFLNGDLDFGMTPLSAVPGAVKQAKADFDASIAAAGVLSQAAWVGWLFYGSRFRKIDTVITDLKGALAIENRVGRHTVQTDNGTTKRIDTLENVVNPSWPDKVEVIISQDPNWPANTIVGFDSRYGYQIVNSTSLSYSATEAFAIRRSQKLRVDSGSASYRLFDDAWQVLSLTV